MSHSMRHRMINDTVTILSLFTVLGPLAACIIDSGDVPGITGEPDAGEPNGTGEMAASTTDSRSAVGRGFTTPGAATVRCGASSCTSNTQACCLDAYAGTATCIDKDVFCGTPTSTGAPATCDAQSDCPKGQSCCLHSGAGYLSILCMPDTECPGDFPSVMNRLLCASPAEQHGCPPDETCAPLDGAIPAGWSVCRVLH